MGLDDIISVLQWNRLQWYWHMLWKEDNDWVKRYTEYELEGTRPRGRPKKTWKYLAPFSKYYQLFPKISRGHITVTMPTGVDSHLKSTNLIRPTCVKNLMTVALVIPGMWLWALKNKIGQVTANHAHMRYSVSSRDNNVYGQCTKFEVFSFIHFQHIYGHIHTTKLKGSRNDVMLPSPFKDG